MEMGIKKRKAEANEKKLQFLKEMLGKLKKHDPGAYNKYEINKARIENLEDLNKYILDIWGPSNIFDHNGNLRRDKYNGDDAVLEELVKAVNTKFRDTANHRTGTPRPPPRGPPPRRPPPRGPPPRGPPPRRPPAAAAIAEQNRVNASRLKAALERADSAEERATAASRKLTKVRARLDELEHKSEPKKRLDVLRDIHTTELYAKTVMEKAMKDMEEAATPEHKENINKLVEQDRDKIRKIFLRQGYCPKKNDITAVEESLIMIRHNENDDQIGALNETIRKKLENYEESNLPSTLAEMLVKERLLFNKISNYGLDVTNILNLNTTEGWNELGLTVEDQDFIKKIARDRQIEEEVAKAFAGVQAPKNNLGVVAGLELWRVGNNSNYNEIYMNHLEDWEAASWELNKKKYEINTPPKQKTEKDLKDSIKDSIKDWINIDTNERDMFSISIKLDDDLKVPYPYFLDKMKNLNNEKYNEIEKNTNDLLNFITPNNKETPFSFIEKDLKDRLRKYYDVEYSPGARTGGAKLATMTTPEEFIVLMAKWCFIIWGYKTLNKNFCNKYLENKKPSSSYTKEQLSLDYRRKITGITRIYKRDDILMKNQFVIKASLNKSHIPDYKKEINNYEKLWEIYKKKYINNNNKKDNEFKVLKYFGSSESKKWHKQEDVDNNGYKGYLSEPTTTDNVNDQEEWKENNLVWEYDNQTKVLTIINKINDKYPLKISTNLDKHAEAITNNGEKTTSNVCWFAIEWDPDFIPFSTSHSGGERDLKLDQTVLRNMKKNIYHLSENYGFYHGDLHTENFLYNIKGDIRRFDFDFSGIINENNVDDVPNDQINVYFGWQPSKISIFLFFNLYKNGTWNDDDSKVNIKWNPTASGKQAYPKHQHLEFLRLFDTHRMLLHYFLSTKGPYNTNVNDIKYVIENIFTEEEEEEKEKRHKKILIESVTNNMYTFWNGSATKKEYEEGLGSDIVYENTWNAGCMYSLLWYFGKYKKKDTKDEDWEKWYDYDNHLMFLHIYLKNLLEKLEASNSTE
tara:strand:+ start:380 stop:3463 length:3084 start_codon:yes stop_codon:yes gene_type:complete